MTVNSCVFRQVRWFPVLLVMLALCHQQAAVGEDSEPNTLAQFYGFTGVELYKLDSRAFNLAAGDFDGNGRTDIVAVDNRSSSIRLFRQRDDGETVKQKTGRSVNDIVFNARFETRQIPVDKSIAGLVTGDFNSDDRADLAYVGAPDRLVIRYQPAKGKEWSDRWSVRLPELDPVAWMVSTGDLNSDGRDDIVVLGKKVIYLLYQNEAGEMDAPVSLINTSAQLALVQVADLDGDGRDDLSYRANEGSSRGLCARLQTNDGRLGPELRFDLAQPRSVTLSNIDNQPGTEILTVDSRTGRVVASRVKVGRKNASELPKRLVRYGVGEANTSKPRSLAIGDIDGNGLKDVVITDPENAQLLVYRQNGKDGLGTSESFPGLLGATGVCTTDVDGDGRAEVVVMSEKESVIGISRFEDGRLSFPKPIYTPPEGFALAAMECLRTPKADRLAVCIRKGSGSRADVQLHYLQVGTDETWPLVTNPQKLSGSAVGTRGVNLLAFDVDENGTEEVLVVPSGAGNKGVTLVTSPEAGEDGQAEPLNLGTTAAGQLFPRAGALYVARESFARCMNFVSEKWSVADQFNAGESRARIAGVAVLDLDGKEGDEVVLVDTGIKKLRALRQDGGLYRPWKEVELGTLRYASSHVADLNGDGNDDVLLLGAQQFAVLYTGAATSELEEVATFESNREDAAAADIIAGDVNGDGQPDLAVIDNKLNGIELLRYDADDGLRAATHFRVFEEKRLVSDSTSRGTEPREGMIVDVTADGRDDLVLLCHDRLIVYPQDSGNSGE